MQIFLFLATDSLIAFKTTLLYSFGLFFLILLKLIYKSPRPFWSDKDIRVYRQTCNFDFSSPSTHMFNMTFFYGYSIFMYFINYTDRVNWTLVYLLYTLLVIVSMISVFGMYLYG